VTVEQELVVDEKQAARVVEVLPRVAERYRQLVDDLPQALARDVREARADIGALLGGEIRLEPDNERMQLIAGYRLSHEALVLKCLNARDKRSY